MPLDGVAVVAFGNELNGCLPNAFLCEAGRYARVRAGPRDAALAPTSVARKQQRAGYFALPRQNR
jgi:hypothetical protein